MITKKIIISLIVVILGIGLSATYKTVKRTADMEIAKVGVNQLDMDKDASAYRTLEFYRKVQDIGPLIMFVSYLGLGIWLFGIWKPVVQKKLVQKNE
jgi:hypothetical protein